MASATKPRPDAAKLEPMARVFSPEASAAQATNRIGLASQVQFVPDANRPIGPTSKMAYPGQAEHWPETQKASKGRQSR